MGKAKKTRAASVKRMINPHDPRLFVVDVNVHRGAAFLFIPFLPRLVMILLLLLLLLILFMFPPP
jgi:hypothetical protein